MKTALPLAAGVAMLIMTLGCSRQHAQSPAHPKRAAGDSPAATLSEERNVEVFSHPALAHLHHEYEREFLEAAGFGLSRIPRMAIQPQALFTLEDGSSWRVLQHNLLGIAEHDEPRVLSVSDSSTPRHLAASVDPDNRTPPPASTSAGSKRAERPLNAFETIAVQRMLAGEPGPWIAAAPEEGPHNFRLLGALRAGSECLECHTAYQKGEALGALVYLIEQVEPGADESDGETLLGFAVPSR